MADVLDEKNEKAGARNSSGDLTTIQTIHDKAIHLGAACRPVKALSLSDQSIKVRDTFWALMAADPTMIPDGVNPESVWIESVLPDQLILWADQARRFSYDYVIDDQGVTFSDPVEVEIEYIPAKALSLSDQIEMVRHSWRKQARRSGSNLAPDGIDPWDMWATTVLPTMLVIKAEGGRHFKYDYQLTPTGDDKVAFSDPVEVEVEYIPLTEEEEEEEAPAEPETSPILPEIKAVLTEGNALKAFEKTDDFLIVGNHLLLYGGRDLEGLATDRINGDGSIGEFFSAKTVWESPYTMTGQLNIDWEHGRDPDQNVAGVNAPARDDILGYADMKTATETEHGLFVKRVLFRRNKYVAMLEPLIEAGLIGTSSEPVQSLVGKAKNGEIETWGLKRDTLSVSPMDYRNILGDNALKLEDVKTALVAIRNEAPALYKAIIGPLGGLIDDTGLDKESEGEQEAPLASAMSTVKASLSLEAELTEIDLMLSEEK